MTSESNLLYITPVVPDSNGTGLAIRAHNVLKALSSKYGVYLLIISQKARERYTLSGVSKYCRDAVFLPVPYLREPWMLFQQVFRLTLPRLYYRVFSNPSELIYVSEMRLKSLRHLFHGIHFDIVHVFRLYTFPFAKRFPYLNRPSLIQLDLDDIESITRKRLGELYELNGNHGMAHAMAYEARGYQRIEKEALAMVDRVFTCSEKDKSVISKKYHGKNVAVLPNITHIPSSLPDKPQNGRFSFLFVGKLDYYPNQDGILFFCREVLPQIRKISNQDFTVRVIGKDAPKGLRTRLSQNGNVEFIGHVPDVTPYYADADTVIVPIRAGGGTRIKILEAFAHQRPVASTDVGSEGIPTQDGTHLLLASTAEGFARQCIRLMTEPGLRKLLSLQAFDLVRDNYGINNIKKVLLS